MLCTVAPHSADSGRRSCELVAFYVVNFVMGAKKTLNVQMDDFVG